eukprot:TRINITY_DN4556_c0_g1_i1.p1 TRINITY_DN4556_c0_g1~~TRINITY_DN4556_c0_g1_i1.p1  ORF type:complete len:671 (+),score=264.89 TRINITY_DN4556_c0_g1_i1:77-2089(+)
MARPVLSLIFLAAVASAVVVSEPPRKQLGGPPSEFAEHILPQPVQAGQVENTAALSTTLQQVAGVAGLSSSIDLPVDSDQLFAFTVFSEALSSLSVTLLDPSGNAVDLSKHINPSNFPLSDDATASVPGTVYVFNAPFATGVYKLSISCATCTTATQTVAIHLFNDNNIAVFSHLRSYSNSFVGQPIGIASRITQQKMLHRGLGATAPKAMVGVVSTAELDMLTPDGKQVDVPMHDDGLHGDGAPNDGVWAATITAAEPGNYVATAVLRGTVNGQEFVRTTQQVIAVLPQDLELTGTATAVTDGQQRLTINLAVSEATSNKYRAYAEVWGVDSNNAETAIAWIGGVVNTVADGSSNVLPLELDLQWVARAGAKAPFTLKNVWVQDISTFMPVSQLAQIPVTTTGNLLGMKKVLGRLTQKPNVRTEITEEMRWGVRPKHLLRRSNATAETTPLVMAHGYCAGRNPFQAQGADFTNAFYFADFNANRPHDEFALLVSAFAEANQLTTWSGVGHSQGGIALLHLHNSYWTGLEVPTNGRLLQSLGSPYLGCTAAGSAAGLGKAFGVGCGENFDLSVDGATQWKTGLSAAALDDVFFYTTTYKRNQFFGDYCNLAVNLVLEWPNDGTAELEYSVLPGANNMGNTESQCHTTGMKYAAQYEDDARNVIINTNRGY